MAVTEREFIRLKVYMRSASSSDSIMRDKEMAELDSRLTDEQRGNLKKYLDYMIELEKLDHFAYVHETNRITYINATLNADSKNAEALKEYHNNHYEPPTEKTREPLNKREFIYVKMQTAHSPNNPFTMKKLDLRITDEQHRKLKIGRAHV